MMSTREGAHIEQPVVQAEGLVRSYGEIRALREVSFSIPAGSVVGFLGPNGAGKTTAIKVLTGSLAADQGCARICGYDVEAQAQEARASIGYLPENNPLYPEMRVDRFLRFSWQAQQVEGASEDCGQAIERVVEATGLSSVYRRAIGDCSKGYRQRVGLAQALLRDPPLLILDEPTNGLDPLQVVEIRELIRRLGRTKTVLLTTHVLSEVEALADRVLLIHQGRKVADDTLETLTSAGDGRLVQISVQAKPERLESVLRTLRLEIVQLRPSVFGLEESARGLVRVTSFTGEQLVSISRAVQEAGLPLLELAPHAGGLEALFQSLDTAGGVSVSTEAQA
ncbi:MAG: ABC transporter ATP-binding protein [Planctomycetes bacterium]|nr:ABC transporter ATP-binding protein [Planctomycetota bacterium]